MKTSFNPNFVRDLKKTKGQVLLGRVEAAIQEIDAADSLADISNLKKMKGYQHVYRIRIGNYRIGIYCENDEVELMRFLPRKDIYRHFP